MGTGDDLGTKLLPQGQNIFSLSLTHFNAQVLDFAWVCSDVDNSRKPGKLPGCERDFPGCKALLISPKCF